MSAANAEQMLGALDDAIAIGHEFDGAGIDEKLAPFGLNADAVRAVVQARWDSANANADLSDEEVYKVFVRAFTEGLLLGTMLGRRR